MRHVLMLADTLPPSFLVRLRAASSSRPAVALRRAQLVSSLAEGHRAAAQSGLDASEHGATLDRTDTISP
jgi:hypothetical protein